MWCQRGVPHHTNSISSIGGGDRFVVWDLHAVPNPGGVELAECTDPDGARQRSGIQNSPHPPSTHAR